MTDNDNDPDIEYSPLCGAVARDGLEVKVQIYRLVGGNDGWSLEVVDREGGSTVWSDTFATDKDAYDEFAETLELEGIRSFSAAKH